MHLLSSYGVVTGNHENSVPVDNNWTPKDQRTWNAKTEDNEAKQASILLDRVKKLKTEGLTGVGIAFDFIKRRIQPLQKRTVLGHLNQGSTDPSPMSHEELSDEIALMRLARFFNGVTGKPYLVKEYSEERPAVPVSK